MERSTRCKVVATSYNQAAAKQNYTFRLPSWMQGSKRKLSSALGGSKNLSLGLPLHSSSEMTTACAPPATILQTPQQTLHIMACMQRGRYRRTVRQDRIDGIGTDQALFCFLRKQVARHRGRIRKMFSLKCVQGMYFVKVSTI
jgi:hypothetical protein